MGKVCQTKTGDNIINHVFLNLGTADIVGQRALYCGWLFVHCRMLGSIPHTSPGLHPQDVSSTPLPSCDNQKCPQSYHMSPKG